MRVTLGGCGMRLCCGQWKLELQLQQWRCAWGWGDLYTVQPIGSLLLLVMTGGAPPFSELCFSVCNMGDSHQGAQGYCCHPQAGSQVASSLTAVFQSHLGLLWLFPSLFDYTVPSPLSFILCRLISCPLHIVPEVLTALPSL